MINLNKKQRTAVKRKFNQCSDNSKNYRDFRKRVTMGFDVPMIFWCNMWLGINLDGTTNS